MSQLRDIIVNSDNAVFFGGAGVSTESGLPDFRSRASRQAAVEAFGLSPEEILSASFFAEDPATFYQYLHRFLHYPHAQPNDAHRSLAEWERAVHLAGVVTQNIDGLHQAAGSNNVWELHGTLATYHCTRCGKTHGQDSALGQIESGAAIPQCACGGILKPDVVLYEEALPADALQNAAVAISEADTLIVGGTSLMVQPAAGLVQLFGGDNLVVVNREETPLDQVADLVIHRPIAQVFSEVEL